MSDRAVALWRRFSGMFGAEALARKFGETPPEEWVISLDRLSSHELERGMKRLVISGKTFIPVLPEFLKLCREVGSSEFPDEMRPAPFSHQIEGPGMKRWDREANLHLMCHVYREIHARRPISPDATRILVEHKHHWAQEMRDAEEECALPADNGKALWEARLRLALDQISQLRQAA